MASLCCIASCNSVVAPTKNGNKDLTYARPLFKNLIFMHIDLIFSFNCNMSFIYLESKVPLFIEKDSQNVSLIERLNWLVVLRSCIIRWNDYCTLQGTILYWPPEGQARWPNWSFPFLFSLFLCSSARLQNQWNISEILTD